MASSGSGNRSNKRPGSGNRRPTPAQGASGGSSSAADRAKDRLQQQRGAGSRAGSQNRRPPQGRQAGRRPSPPQGRSTAMTAGIFGGVLVVLVVVIIVLFSVLGGSGNGIGASEQAIATRPAPANIVKALKDVPSSALAAAGNGGGYIAGVGAKGTTSALVKVGAKPLTAHGKPEIVYMGAEFCPYCAATRWPLVIAMDRFGSFKGLEISASSPLDAFTNTRTLSFAKATYSSPYVSFHETEQTTNTCPKSDIVANPNYSSSEPSWYDPPKACESHPLLQATPKWVQKLADKYDTTAWVGKNANGIPFIYFGGKYLEVSSLYLPTILHGASWDAIVKALQVPTSGIGQQVLGAANRYTAIICAMTNDKPASVCNAPYMKTAEKALG